MELPRSVWKPIDRGVAAGRPQRVLLFGSQARGEGRPTSDFDLAFEGVEDARAWQVFRLDGTLRTGLPLPPRRRAPGDRPARTPR